MASFSSIAHLFSFFSPSKPSPPPPPPPPTRAPNQLIYLYVSTNSLPSLSTSSRNGLAPVVPTIIDNNPLSSSSTSWNKLMPVVHPSLAFANTLFFRPAKSDSSSSDDDDDDDVDEDEKLSSTPEEKRREGGGSSDGNIVGPRFKDLGGTSGVIEELFMEVIVPLFHPLLPRHLGVKPMARILLHGPPGCGKTKLANAIANETGLPFYKTSATELVSVYSGDTEKNIRELFSKAYRTAPSIVFIDEIDAIASKREDLEWEKDRRIVTQLMTCMDNSNRLVQPADGNGNSESYDGKPGNILVIGATNRPDALDPALRRLGRFDREIVLGVPDENARVDIVSKLTHKLKVEGAFDPLNIARSTPGFVGADLAALTYKACNLAMKRICDHRKAEVSNQPVDAERDGEWWRHPWSHEEMEKLSITMADFEEASKLVQPSSTRKGFSSVPNVKWEDVGGLHMLRQEFDQYVVHRIKYPDIYADFGIDIATGILLYGPPGCGKTLIAKAVANEAGANFIYVKGPEVLNKYVGESELAVRRIFSRARTCSPCIIFFDEVDALTPKRGRERRGIDGLVNQLLIELDGADQRKGVYVIGSTNRPEIMDPALLRPGRFGKLLYVSLPSLDEHGLILKALARKKPIDPSVDLMAVAKDGACENLSGADLAALMNDAAMAAVQDEQTNEDGAPRTIKDIHFKRALEKIAPSVSDKQRQHYQLLSESFKFASGSILVFSLSKLRMISTFCQFHSRKIRGMFLTMQWYVYLGIDTYT